MRMLSWTLVAYLMAVQTANLIDTASRHPYIGKEPLAWEDIERMHAGIARGDLADVLTDEPFLSRRFFYAFETAAAFESAAGRRVDFNPMDEAQDGLVRYLDITANYDPKIAPLKGPSPDAEKEAFNATLVAKPVNGRVCQAGTIRGETGSWGYTWRFDGTGAVVQKSWRFGLMRVWSSTGRVEQRGDEVCLIFPTAASTCFTALYQHR